MKYIDAEKLKETIKYHIRCFEKELQSFSDEDYICSAAAQYAIAKASLENVRNIIDSFPQEQPEGGCSEIPNDLEEAADNYISPIENEQGLSFIGFSGQDIKDAFIDGAKWQYRKDRYEFAKLKAKEWISGYDEGLSKAKEH